MTYPLTFFVKSLPLNVGGCANGPIIRILDKYRHDEGLYRHELMHVKQWSTFAWLSIPLAYALYHFGYFDYIGVAILPMALHSALYRLIPRYRLWAEVSAYKEQSRFYPDDRRALFAEFISMYYDLKITPEQALKHLKG
jgi:hypothetical protein